MSSSPHSLCLSLNFWSPKHLSTQSSHLWSWPTIILSSFPYRPVAWYSVLDVVVDSIAWCLIRLLMSHRFQLWLLNFLSPPTIRCSIFMPPLIQINCFLNWITILYNFYIKKYIYKKFLYFFYLHLYPAFSFPTFFLKNIIFSFPFCI